MKENKKEILCELEIDFQKYLELLDVLENYIEDFEKKRKLEEIKKEKIIKFEEKFAILFFLEHLISSLLVGLIAHRNAYIKTAFESNEDFKDIWEKINYNGKKIRYKSLVKLTLGKLKNIFESSFSKDYLNKFDGLLKNLNNFIEKRNYIHHRILFFPPKYSKEELENELEEAINLGKDINKKLKDILYDFTGSKINH